MLLPLEKTESDKNYSKVALGSSDVYNYMRV